MNSMRPPKDTGSRALPGLLAVVVVSIVLGIIGMHALSTHGVMGATDPSAMTVAAASPVTGARGDISIAPVNPATRAHAGMSHTSPAGGDPHSLSSMVMLCFAMVAATAGAILLLFLGVHRRSRVWAHHPTLPAAVTRCVTARIGAGPPYVWQFSVIRC